MDSWLSGLKATLLIPDNVTNFDQALKTYVYGAKSYVDGILDNVPSHDDLYSLTIINMAAFEYINRDNPKIKNLPVTVNALLNRLKTKYSD